MMVMWGCYMGPKETWIRTSGTADDCLRVPTVPILVCFAMKTLTPSSRGLVYLQAVNLRLRVTGYLW